MTGTPVPRPHTAMRRRITAAFTEHIWLKATAVFIAVVAWFGVNVKEPQSALVNVRFAPVLDSSLVIRDQLPQIQALVAGSPKELIKLNSNLPVIRRAISPGVPDTLVVDLRPQDVILPEGVDAVVRVVAPSSVILRFEPTLTHKVPVHAAIDVATSNGTGFGPVAVKVDPSVVEISGPRRLVGKIRFVKTIRTTITFPDSLPHLVELDSSNLGPGVRLKPNQVKVMLQSSGRH